MGFGTSITLGFEFVGPDVNKLPKITKVDKLEADGSLLLIDMTHPLASYGSGVPANGTFYKNLAGANATSLIGSADTNVQVVSKFESPTLGKVERTAKGGIHVIQSTTMTNKNEGFQLRLPESLVRYLKANPTHSYFVSQWGRTTRPYPSTAVQHAVAGLSAFGASSFAFSLGNSSGTMGGGPVTLGIRHANPETAGKYNLRNGGVKDFAPDFYTAAYTPELGSIFEVGNYLAPNSGNGKVGQRGAQVFYRGYMEDLTVSGRTYAQADALDLAEYTKECLTVGGRYYGDNIPTDPATIP